VVIDQGGHRAMRFRGVTLLVCVVAGLVALAGLAAEADAQQYPSRPVEVVVPFVPGGGTDLIARATEDYLGEKWSQPLLVVNKPGGGGVIGARSALKEARPDGYTVLVDIHTTAPMMIGAWKMPPLTLADRKWAGRIVLDPMVFAVKADAPWSDLKELSAWVKTHPAELIWSSVGPSGISRYTAFDWFSQIGGEPNKDNMGITAGGAGSQSK